MFSNSIALAKVDWKERKRKMTGPQFRNLIEELHKAISDRDSLIIKNKELVNANKELANKHKIDQRLKGQMDALSIYGFSQDEWAFDEKGEPYIKGVVFSVQIGAYRKRDLSDLLESRSAHGSFRQKKEDGLSHYTLGYHRDYDKARKLKKHIVAMGIKDAFIVVYADGKRMEINKEVFDKYIKKK